MSIRKILLGACAVMALGAGGVTLARGGLAAPAAASTTPAVAPPIPAPGPLTETPFHFGSFGAVTIYRRATEPARFVVLISDEAGWTPALTAQARSLTAQDATVVGVDLRRFLPAAERAAGAHGLYPAGDFSELAQAAQKALKFSGYHRPILIGQGAGAALAYGTLAQSPVGIFQGGGAIDFRSDLATTRALIPGDGGLSQVAGPKGAFAYQPNARLSTPFVAVAPDAAARAFSAAMPQGRTAADLSQALATIQPAVVSASQPSAARLAGLPLVEVPSASNGDTLAVFYSGDGGWAGIDQGLAQGFVKAGVPVVGYDSLRYFWTRRTPQAAADDLAAVIRHYQAAWGKQRVILAGYSFGADALPIIVQHLPADLRGQVRIVALLGTDSTGELEFHPGDWLDVGAKDSYPIAPVLSSLKDLRIVCVYGAQEHGDACPSFPAEVRKIGLPGDHHFDGDYDAVGRALSQAAGLTS
jgi:type IV secretory pathway VirJ component